MSQMVIICIINIGHMCIVPDVTDKMGYIYASNGVAHFNYQNLIFGYINACIVKKNLLKEMCMLTR